MVEPQARPHEEPENPDFVAWGAGCLVGGATLLGMLVLVYLISLALPPPRWVQIVVGIVLAAVGTIVAWLTANAVGDAKKHQR